MPRPSFPILIIVCAMWVAAGCGTPAPTRTAAVTPCRLSQFSVTLRPYISEPTEQHTLALRLVNLGDRACTLFGYPRTTFYDKRGLLRFRIKHGGDQMIPARTANPVRVRPGRSAFLVLNKNVCVSGATRGATMIRMSTAQTTQGGSASFTGGLSSRMPDFCREADDPGSVITESSFVSSLRAAFNG
jgi:hypothetical protein